MFFDTNPAPGIVLDNRWSRGADMLVGRKPVGPVEIDRTHKARPEYCLLLNESGPEVIDIGTCKRYASNVGSGADDTTWVVENGERGLYFPNSINVVSLDWTGNMYGFSMFTLYLENGITTGGGLNLFGFNGSIALRSGAVTSYLTNESLTVYGANNFRTGITDGSTWGANERVHIFVWWNGANYDFFVNGRYFAGVAGTQGHTELIAFGNNINFPDGSETADKVYSSVMAWTRPIPRGVAESISMNPYQFFKPAGR